MAFNTHNLADEIDATERMRYIVDYYNPRTACDGRYEVLATSTQEAVEMARQAFLPGVIKIHAAYLLINMKGEWK